MRPQPANKTFTDRESWLLAPLDQLLQYCRDNQWAGWDPFDGLNSPLLRLPLLQNRPFRLGFIQFCKRSPINLRPLLRVPKQKNPKGLALFISALCRLARLGLTDQAEIEGLISELLASRSPGVEFDCWGYNFDWQTRYHLVPRFSPNIICTTFAGNALLDAYEALGDRVLLDSAISASQFLLRSLQRSGNEDSFCFSYTPRVKDQIHNANLLGAAFLARLYSLTGTQALLRECQAATRFSVERIRSDGSWPYGEGPKQQWIDSFHTGYNLVALNTIRRCTGEPIIQPVLQKAFAFYMAHFFGVDGLVKYYHDRTFPVDSHAVAHAIMTLVDFSDQDSAALSLARKVCQWSLSNMRASQGWFYYQKRASFTVTIPYMRWCQAWMLLGMAVLADRICGSVGAPDRGSVSTHTPAESSLRPV